MPSEAGYPLGGTDGYKSFYLEIHYDNRNGVSNVQDSSGFQIYTLKQADGLRQYDAAVLELADPLVSLGGTALESGYSKYEFECPSTCTQNEFQVDSVMVFQEWLHMHEHGIRMTNEQIRGGNTIHTGIIDYYDFAQSGGHLVQQPPFSLQRGDAFKTTCYYDGTGGVSFGQASTDEMCIAYLSYYPKQSIAGGYSKCSYGGILATLYPDCASTVASQAIANEEGLERTFGVDPTQCGNTTITTTSTTSTSTTTDGDGGGGGGPTCGDGTNTVVDVGTGSLSANSDGQYYDFNGFEFSTMSAGDKVDFVRTVTETQHPFRLCSAEPTTVGGTFDCPTGTQLGDSDLTYVDNCVTVTLTDPTWYFCTVHDKMAGELGLGVGSTSTSTTTTQAATTSKFCSALSLLSLSVTY